MKNQKETPRPNHGDEVKDIITGYVGIVVAKVIWINGCLRCVVQGKVDKDGKVPDPHTFDEPDLEVVRAGVVPFPYAPPIEGGEVTAPPGGPIPTPTQTPKVKSSYQVTRI